MTTRPYVSTLMLLAAFAAHAASVREQTLPAREVPCAFGPNVHITGPDEDFDLMKDAGFGFIRKDMFWNSVERSKGNYNFGTYERILDAMEARGMRALFILCYGNKIYSQAETTEEGREAYARFAAAAVEHFKGRRVIWEIWNEPNVKHFWKGPGDHNSVEFADQYVKLVKKAVPAMREADPDCFIAVTATSCLWVNSFRWLKACFEKGLLQEDIDAVSVHPYGFRMPEHAIDKGYGHLREMMAEHEGADIPVINSEVGYDLPYLKKMGSNDENCRDHQGWYCARQYLVDMMCDVRLTIWYKWKANDFGVVNPDRSARPAFNAAKTLTDQLRGFHFAKRLPAGSDLDYLLLFEKDTGEKKLAAWTVPPRGEDDPAKARPHQITIPLVTSACSLDTCDVFGTEDTVAASGGGITLTLTGAPRYVTLCDERAAPLTSEAEASTRPAAKRTQPTEVALAMFDELLRGRVADACAAGDKVSFFSSSVRAKLVVRAVGEDGAVQATVERTGTAFTLRWAKLTLAERAAMAAVLLRDGDEVGHAIAAFYLIAAGDDARGRDCLASAGALADEVRQAFK